MLTRDKNLSSQTTGIVSGELRNEALIFKRQINLRCRRKPTDIDSIEWDFTLRRMRQQQQLILLYL